VHSFALNVVLLDALLGFVVSYVIYGQTALACNVNVTWNVCTCNVSCLFLLWSSIDVLQGAMIGLVLCLLAGSWAQQGRSCAVRLVVIGSNYVLQHKHHQHQRRMRASGRLLLPFF
jgi:hypothetical protein